MDEKRKLRRIVVGVVAAAAGAVAVVFPTGASAKPTFTLYQHDTDQARLDLGTPGRGVGDQYIFGGDLTDRRGGTKLGRSAGDCASSSFDEMLCAAALRLADGQITFEGLIVVADLAGSRPVDFAITGGTGRYQHARGTVTITIVPGLPGDANVVVDLN
jgi:hypothetical protein